jgi:hypothetical protein
MTKTSKTETYWLNTGWATGGVIVEDGIIIDGAPIFRKLIGQKLVDVMTKGTYNAQQVGYQEENDGK